MLEERTEERFWVPRNILLEVNDRMKTSVSEIEV